jgi:signal transduction histidine kinase
MAIEIEGSSPPVNADAELLKIVFQNLLINAAQAMQRRGKIRVLVTSSDRMCDLSFIDSGPGIPPDVLEKIFIPFFTTKSRGTGLGLPTAKRLIEAHGGVIAVNCPDRGGTVVMVRLPLMRAGATAPGAGPVLEPA